MNRESKRKPIDPNSLMSEKEFQGWVVDLATAFRWKKQHNSDSRRADAGWPDLVFGKPGHGIIACELKKQNGRVDPEQLWWLDRMRESGVPAFLWRPSDRPEIEAFFRNHKPIKVEPE